MKVENEDPTSAVATNATYKRFLYDLVIADKLDQVILKEYE
jgi:hypothetical protein